MKTVLIINVPRLRQHKHVIGPFESKDLATQYLESRREHFNSLYPVVRKGERGWTFRFNDLEEPN
jgi:hypothetical protein